MRALAAFFILIFAVSFLGQPRLGAGWIWDLGQGIGFAAFAGLLFQMIPARRQGTGRAHARIGDAVVMFVLAHGFWLLLSDDALRVYLQPGAPLHMWLGLAALLLLTALSVLAHMPERMRLHRHYAQFRLWHRWLGALATIAAALHIVLSGFSLPGWPSVLALVALTLLCCLGRGAWGRLGAPFQARLSAYVVGGACFVAVFAMIRNFGT